MANKRHRPKHRQFCKALLEESGGVMRWATIMGIARRLKMDVRVAVLLSAECAAAGLVWLDVKGPPYALLPSSARLTEHGWKVVTRRAVARKKPKKGKSGGG
jgi:hypothetical protein